jgi:hypothetical protein
VREQFLVNNIAAFLKRIDGAFEIDGVPKCDGGDNQFKPLARCYWFS